MIKRSESKSKCSRRHRQDRVTKKRRLMMEGLEKRQLLAVLTEPPTAPPPTNLPTYTVNRNIGAVQSFLATESETFNQAGLNDLMSNADFLQLGTGPGQQDTIDVSATLPVTSFIDNTSGFSADIDTFSFDLRGGDILDIATLGAAGGITVRDSNGTYILISDVLIGGADAPRQSLGNASGTVVIPNDGRYYVTTSPQAADTTGNYTLGLRVYRPTAESLAIGDTQVLYLDFSGSIIDNNIFNDALVQGNPGLPVGGVTRVRSLFDSLPILGLELGDTAAANRIIDITVDEITRIFEDLVRTGANGDIESPNAQPGDYGIRILNSRDHFGQVSFDDPRVSRLLIGGTGDDFGVAGVYGIAQSVDIGNFDLNEFGIFALDAFAGNAATVPISPSASQVDFIGKFLGGVAAHEAGHVFGDIHTDNANTIANVGDAGGTPISIENLQSLGDDGIFGTSDDYDSVWNVDFYMPGQVPDLNGFATYFAPHALSHVLASGTVGTSASGRVFNDANKDGNGAGDPGLAGVTVFADLNDNGAKDAGEPMAVTGDDGTFSLPVGSSGVTIIAITPTGFSPTTSTTASGAGSAVFGFTPDEPSVTGRTFVDSNRNGFADAGEGFEGVYLYLDMDGDNRPDLGEPAAMSRPDGTYTMPYPGPGPFTLRADIPPGFEQTVPASGEYNNAGPSAGSAFDFGFLPAQDFGDLPDSYATTLGADGARHGIITGLSIGSLVDRENNGRPTNDAMGDDLAGVDDEDGVVPRLDTARNEFYFDVTVNNTSGTVAYLQAFADFNIDGDFDDPGEQFATNEVVPSSLSGPMTVPLLVDLDGATPGSSYARFRLSQTPGIGSDGFANTGEVEDYAFEILSEAKLANPDLNVQVFTNTPKEIFVLDNDFQTPSNPLDITNFTQPANGRVTPGQRNGEQFLIYIPNNGFRGNDSFRYFVEDQFGNTADAMVTVKVVFQSDKPIALDDSFEVPEGSVNRPLNVLDNDIPSIFGGVSISSVTAGSSGGRLDITGGGQSLRYTPQPGFDGTEQFTYTIIDSANQSSSATGTVNLLPGALGDDKVDFSIGFFDTTNRTREINSIQAGHDFIVRVFVDDLTTSGVAAAHLDLLYSNTLVTTSNVPPIFGSLFPALQTFDLQTPGLIDEIGAVQSVANDLTEHDGPVMLFELTMSAVSPGVAVFNADPADDPTSETVVFDDPNLPLLEALTPKDLRLGREELLILPPDGDFVSAVDDSFPDGKDSNGFEISAGGSRHQLRVLENDNLFGALDAFAPLKVEKGIVFRVDVNGTPGFLNDDVLSYEPFAGEDDYFERITYFIQDDDVVSIGEVTFPVGNPPVDVMYNFALVDGVRGDGVNTPITEVSVGDRIGVEVRGFDDRFNPTFVFAGFQDVLYDSNVLVPAPAEPGDPFDFSVDFGRPNPPGPGPDYVSDPDKVNTTAATPNIIDEFGTLAGTIGDLPNNSVIGTIYFDVVGGSGQTTRVVGSPADASPFTDTLLKNLDTPVPVSRIEYDVLEIAVSAAAVAPLQNAGFNQDVNDDGVVSPIDALLVINQISRGSAAEAELIGDEATPHYYTDVNGDYHVSAIDALLVINYLTQSGGNQAAAEQIAPQGESNTTDLASESNDAVFAAIEQTEDSVQADFAYNAPVTNAPISPADNGAGDSDEDEMLDLLADDVSGLWAG